MSYGRRRSEQRLAPAGCVFHVPAFADRTMESMLRMSVLVIHDEDMAQGR